MTQPGTVLYGAEGGASTSEDDLVWLAENAPDAPLDEFGNRPIHYAAKHGSIDAITQIIALGADPTITNFEGQRASDVARSAGHIEVALALRGYERKTRPPSKNQSAVSNKLEKNSGDFSPTPSTNLLNVDTDWALPDDLSDDVSAGSYISEINKITQEIDFISDRTSVQANIMLWSLYSRVRDLFENLKPLMMELNRSGSTISDINYENIYDDYIHPFHEIKEFIQNPKSKNPDDILDEIYDFCETELNESYGLGSLISLIQVEISQGSSNIINLVRMISSFSDMFDGDLFENRESGDQDFLNPNIKLVPPVFEAAEKFEKDCEQFFNDWGKNFIENTKWDGRHWIVPD